jgi:hypothetical protein
MTPRTARLALPQMTETELLGSIRTLATLTGWLSYHTHDSRHSEPGFPDLVLASTRQGRLIIAELKDATRKATDEQRKWLATLSAIGIETALWRPAQWHDGTIQRALKGERLTPYTDPKD